MLAPKPPVSLFVPADIDATRFENIEPLVRDLLERPVTTARDLEAWIIDRGELAAACSEARADLYIAMTCDTENQEAQKAYQTYVTDVAPRLTPAFFELDRRMVQLAGDLKPDPARFGVLIRAAKADVDLFREENVPLQTELDLLSNRYDRINGAMTVVFEGQEKTLPQMARYQQETDRALRESAWRAVAERRLKDADEINDIFDQMIDLRTRLARNAGFDNFIGYTFKSMHRFDYSVEHCNAFHKAVETHVVPFMRRFEDERARKLSVSPLRPWDLAVDPLGRGPLRPFTTGAELFRRAVTACRRLDPRLADLLASLGDGGEARGSANGACLDLDSRKGKAPGGYQYNRDRTRRPFIFMNAAGLHRDVETMVHEAGHAFHSMLCADEPIAAYRHSPIEFAEVASMSMELLTMDHWGGQGGYYPDQTDFRRAKREQLKGSVLLLPWIATIDAFQHWVYANPGHTRADREKQWLALDARFGNSVSWEGLEHIRPHIWQRQLHLFSHPFYFIEYGIAQLGAFQLWLTSLEKGQAAAVDAYIRALSLGGSRPLPDLFSAAGLAFDFGPATVQRITERISAELDKVPE